MGRYWSSRRAGNGVPIPPVSPLRNLRLNVSPDDGSFFYTWSVDGTIGNPTVTLILYGPGDLTSLFTSDTQSYNTGLFSSDVQPDPETVWELRGSVPGYADAFTPPYTVAP